MDIAIDRTRLPLLVCVAAFTISGCESLNLTIAEPPTFDSSEWVDIAELHSIDEIDKVLSHRLNSPSAQTHCEALISGWGKHDSWYDLIVVKFIWEHWEAVYGEHHELDYERVMKQIQDRINEQPELLNQVCWYVQWKYGPWNMPRLCRWLEAQVLHGRYVIGEEFPYLLYVAGLAGTRGGLASAVSTEWDKIFVSLYIAKLEFLAGRPFLIYDNESGRFKYDEPAVKQSRYVSVERQHMTPRKTPLPKWIGPIPVRKEDPQPSQDSN